MPYCSVVAILAVSSLAAISHAQGPAHATELPAQIMIPNHQPGIHQYYYPDYYPTAPQAPIPPQASPYAYEDTLQPQQVDTIEPKSGSADEQAPVGGNSDSDSHYLYYYY